MSFDFNDLANIGGTSPAPIIFSYVTQDTKPEILAIGYFNPGFGTFTVDDIIVVVTNEGTFNIRVIAAGKSNVVVQIIQSDTTRILVTDIENALLDAGYKVVCRSVKTRDGKPDKIKLQVAWN